MTDYSIRSVEEFDDRVRRGEIADNETTRALRQQIVEEFQMPSFPDIQAYADYCKQRGIPLTVVNFNLIGQSGEFTLGLNGEIIAKDDMPIPPAPPSSLKS
jgi:hypothetical protein